jgi:hypothetical protein
MPAGSIGKLYPYAMIAAISFCALAIIPVWGFPFGSDFEHHYRLAVGFFDAMTSGDAMPSWLASTNGGYGDPSVRFYPPLLYWLIAGFHLAGLDWFFASFATFFIFTFVGGAGMYLWASDYAATRYAVAAAGLYIVSPFHANEFYQASLFAQYAAACVLPFGFALVDRITTRSGWRYCGLFALAFAVFLLLNPPFALVGTLSVAVYILLRMVQNGVAESFVRMFVAVSLAFLIASFFWVTAAAELAWKAPVDLAQSAWFLYSNNFLFGLGDETRNYWLNYLSGITSIFVLCAAVLIFRWRRQAIAPLGLVVFTFLMSTPLSKPLWDVSGVLQQTQFPWRFLTITTAGLIALNAIALPEIFALWRTKYRPLTIALTGGLLIVVCFFSLQIVRGATFIGRGEMNSKVESLRSSYSNGDFLPIWADPRPRKMETVVEIEGRNIEIRTAEREHIEFAVSEGGSAEARLRLFYYPRWRAVSAGQELPTAPTDDGALMVSVPEEASVIDVRFEEPFLSKAASWISLAAFAAAVGLVLFGTRSSPQLTP